MRRRSTCAFRVLHQRWFIHVAQGQNIRTAAGLPVTLTKKQARHFLQTPDDFGIMSGFRWAQISDLVESERSVRSVLSTRVATDFHNDEFWSGIPPYRLEEGDGYQLKVYSITELLSSHELEDEGRAISH